MTLSLGTKYNSLDYSYSYKIIHIDFVEALEADMVANWHV
jgi:hypothetical protein